MKQGKRFYYFAGGILAVPLLFFAAAALYVAANSEVIKEKLVDELNKETGAHITISGKVELSFFRHFPDVALELKGVQAQGSIDTLDEPLLKAGRIYLLANFWEVLHGEWNIQSTSVEDGAFTMLRTKEGAVNYVFASDGSDSTHATAFSLNVQKASLKNMRYRLLDALAQVEIDVLVEEAAVSGNFSTENLSLHAVADVFSHSVAIKGVDYAREKPISFDGSLAVALDKENYALNVTRFSAGKNEFAINGTIEMQKGNPVFDLSVRGKNIAVKDIPALLPAEFAERMNGINGSGNLQVAAQIAGALNDKQNPAVTLTADVSRATLQIPGMEGRITDLSLSGTFTNGSKQRLATSVVSVKNFSGKIKQGELNGSFVLSNLEHPNLKVNADGVIELSIMNRFLPETGRLKEIGGTIQFKNARYNGKVADLQAGRLQGLEGSVSVSNMHALIDGSKVSVPQAQFSAYDKMLTIDNLQVKLPETDISLSGKINQMPGLSGKGNVPSAELTLKSESINVKELIALAGGHESKTAGGNKKPLSFIGKIAVKAAHIVYDKFNAYDASGSVVLNGEEAELKNFSCNTVDGTLDFSSTIKMKDGKYITSTHASGADININEMFAQLNNFNQTAITAENISGKLTFTADVNADFVQGELDEKNLSAVVALVVKKGELMNLKSLESLSRFIDVEELRHVKFSTLRNKISISNQTITIPEMLVESNAINISLSGSQTFQGAIDYSVKLNLFDVLGKKIRKRKDLTEYEEEGQNDFNFYLRITGTRDNPSVKYDRRSAKDKHTWQNGEITQTNEAQEETSKKEPVGLKEKIFFQNKRKKENTQDEEPEFIEWEDDPSAP